MTPALAEAIRAEIRLALDAGGKPFTVAVAKRVYDLAIAAKDFLVSATETVEEAVGVIATSGGPLDSLMAPANPPKRTPIPPLRR